MEKYLYKPIVIVYRLPYNQKMQTREAAELVGLKTYQVKYLIRNGVITPASEMKNGIAYEFDYPSLVRLSLAAQMLKDKYRLDAIRQALTQLDAHWLSGESAHAGYLLVLENGLFYWHFFPIDFYHTDSETKTKTPVYLSRPLLYRVTDIAAEIEEKLERIELEKGADDGA